MNNTYSFLGLFQVQLAPGFDKFSDVFTTITGKFAALLIILIGLPEALSHLPADMQAQVPVWLPNICRWLAFAVAIGLLPGRATKEGGSNLNGNNKGFSTIGVLIVLALASMVAVSFMGCDKKYSRADQQAFAGDVKVTAAIAAADGYASFALCSDTDNMMPCRTKPITAKVAPVVKRLSDAYDKYEDAIYAGQGGAGSPILIEVNAALAALDAILADQAIQAALKAQRATAATKAKSAARSN